MIAIVVVYALAVVMVAGFEAWWRTSDLTRSERPRPQPSVQRPKWLADDIVSKAA